MGMAIWNVLLELAPSLLLGAALAGVMHVLLPTEFAARQLRGTGGVFRAVAFGVPLPLCSCGVLPAGLGLKRDGASDGAVVGFLISTPQTGVDSMLVSASFLGWPFALFKVFSAAVTGVIGGWLAERVVSGPAGESPPVSRARAPRGWRSMIAQALEILRSIWGWLVIGVLISAAIEVWVPAEVWAHVATWGGLGAACAALIISLPLYVCATASVPIAAALVAGGMPAGAALVFLMAGPATNAATVGAIYRSFGARILGVYLGTLILGSMAFGLAFDFLLGGAAAAAAHEHHAEPSWWALASTFGLLGLLAWFALDDVRRWLRARSAGPVTGDESALTLPVGGMTCNSCVQHLESTLRQEAGVESAEASLDPGRVVVRGTVPEPRVRELIAEAGYSAG